jgi:hypothetical protein
VSCFPPAAAAVLCNAGDAQPDLQAKVQGVQRSRRRGRARKKLHSSIRTQQQLKLLEQQHQVSSSMAACAQAHVKLCQAAL